MLTLFRKANHKTEQDNVIDWLKNISQVHPMLSKEIELAIAHWSVPDFRFQKEMQISMPSYFTEWFARVELVGFYETAQELKPCTMFNAVKLIDEQLTPVAIHFEFTYRLMDLTFDRRITLDLDIEPMLKAAKDNDYYKQKAALTLRYLTAIYAAKIARQQFLLEKKGIKYDHTTTETNT